MNTLHEMLVDHLKRIVPELASDLISTKLLARGLRLTDSEKRRLTASIIQSQSSVQFRKWRFWERQSLQLDFTPEDIKQIEEKSVALVQKLPQLLESLFEDITNYMTNVLKERWPAQKLDERRRKQSFESNLADTWRHPMDLLSMILTIASELGAILNDELRRENENSRKFSVDVLTRLHARACQVSGEVIRLLSSGYADGAMARWRTLHEIAVVALFIQQHGEEVAERYLRHSAVESYRAAANYERFRERLGEPPLEQSELSSLGASYDEAVNRFGGEFTEAYGWAASTIGNPNPKFVDIERNVGSEHLRPYYKMASYNVHANPKGVFFKLGLIPEAQLLLAGPSNFGLADPGQHTAFSLCQVSFPLIMLRPTMDSILSGKIMLALSKEAAESFVAVQHAIEEQESLKTSSANAS